MTEAQEAPDTGLGDSPGDGAGMSNPRIPGQKARWWSRPRPRVEWAAQHRATILYLRVELAEVSDGSTPVTTDPRAGDARKIVAATIEEAEHQLEAAEDRWWIARFLLRSRTYDSVEALLNEALGCVMLVASPEAVIARVPTLRAEMRRYLGSDDQRRDAYTRILDRFESELVGAGEKSSGTRATT